MEITSNSYLLLYFGFREIVLEDYEYERGDIAFEYIADEAAAGGALTP